MEPTAFEDLIRLNAEAYGIPVDLFRNVWCSRKVGSIPML
jgi:hypothetical protein